MKKFIFFMIALAFLPVIALSQFNIVSADSNIRGVVLFSTVQEDNEITITATLKENNGISSLLLTLDYDLSVMQLEDVDTGDALSEMNLIQTDHSGINGYAVPDYKFHWLTYGDQNCTSTGTLLVLKFKVLDQAENGKYKVSLKYDKSSDVLYYDGNDELQGNFVIDKAYVSINNGKIEVTINDESNLQLYIIIGSSVIIVGCIITAIVIIAKRRKIKKGWQKI